MTFVRGLLGRIDWQALRRVGLALPLMTISLVVLVAVFWSSLQSARPDAPGTQLALSELLAMADDAELEEVTLLDADSRAVAEVDGDPVWAAYPASGATTELLIRTFREAGTDVLIDQQNDKRRATFLAQFVLPLLLLANLFGLLFVAGRSGGARDLLSFSRLFGAKDRTGGEGVGFASIAGIDAAVTELREIVDYLADPTRFEAIGAAPPKGVLLVGPPGCGKTLLARAVAGEAGVPFFSISGSEFVESLVGVGAARVRDLFRRAQAEGAAIIFIDELDAAGRRRGAGVGSGHDEREQTLNELLVQMDGFAATSGLVVIGATNRPDILDPALLRPGRFDRRVTVDLPDVSGREAILGLHARGKVLDDGLQIAEVARRTPGFSGADLANLLNEAALLAVRAGRTSIGSQEATEAIERVLAGPRTTSHRLDDTERERIAFHEAGHAVAAAARRGLDEIPKVTIITRGRHVGHLEVLQRSDRAVRPRSELLEDLLIAMAGIAAEEIIFKEPSTASEGDLERATETARRIVARYGMTDAVGRVQILEREEEVFLGRDYLQTQHLSPAVLEAVDAEVRRLLDEAEESATRLLRRHLKAVRAVAQGLLDHEVLEGDALHELLPGGSATT